MSSNNFSRRKFLAGAAAVGAASAMGVGTLASCNGGGGTSGVQPVYTIFKKEIIIFRQCLKQLPTDRF
jgi:myo-inositol 2-dehydrogenase / D-chiro-inositol 1-dehydrogenase